MMDFYRLFKLLIRRSPIIIGCSLFTAILIFFLTKNVSKEYVSEAIIYTGIGTGESYMREKQENTARYAFDNLLNIVKSRETLKEVGLRLMAQHLMLDKADPRIITAEHFEHVRQQIPPDIRKLVGDTEEKTYSNLASLADIHPFLIAQINYPAPYYSTAALSNINVRRIMSSDMVNMSYSSNDQGICQKTLEILIDVSIRNFRKLSENQTDSVVAYFEKQLQLAREQLKRSEEKDLQFKKTYNLVNFDIQTGIAISQREDILSQINKEKEVVSSSGIIIKNLEAQMGSQTQQALKNRAILDKQQMVRRLSSQLRTAEMSNESSEKIANLQLQLNQVKDDLSKDLSSAGGSSSQMIMTQYINKVMDYEESKARLQALENRKNITLGEYDRFVPLGDTLKRIQREIDINEKAFFVVLESLNLSKQRQQDKQSVFTIQVIDKPNYPLVPKPTDRKMTVILGLMIGGIIPAVIFFFMAFFDNNIRTIQRAEELTGLKSGGIFPNMKALNAYKNPEQINESLSNTILKNIYLNDKTGQQRILIISTRPFEGKTTISNLLCERILQKGKKCLVVIPYLDSGSWSVVSYKVDNAFFQSKAEDLVPVERLNDTDVLILELPSLIMNDYPVALIKQFNIAFLVCDANREWTNADQTALESFINISGIKPYLILNDVDKDIVEEVLGKI